MARSKKLTAEFCASVTFDGDGGRWSEALASREEFLNRMADDYLVLFFAAAQMKKSSEETKAMVTPDTVEPFIKLYENLLAVEKAHKALCDLATRASARLLVAFSNLELTVGGGQRMTRAEAEALIQRAIDALDTIDGDPDLEPDEEDCCAAGDDAPVVMAVPWAEARIGDDDDAEDNGDLEKDDDDMCCAGDDRGTFHRPRPAPVFYSDRSDTLNRETPSPIPVGYPSGNFYFEDGRGFRLENGAVVGELPRNAEFGRQMSLASLPSASAH